MKNKEIKFKNPFDLMDEDEQNFMSQPQFNHKMSPPRTVIIPLKQQPQLSNPLPFNPYEDVESTTKNSSTKINNQEGNDKMNIGYQQQIIYQQPPEKIWSAQQLDENGDPPLLQDIGIEPDKIIKRVKLILKMSQPTDELLIDPDLSGPVIIALCLGILLLLAGKIHFGDIYAMFILGNLLVYILFNFLSQIDIIPLYNIMSTLGYALLPMLVLGILGIFISLKSSIGIIVALSISAWSSYGAGQIMQALMRNTLPNRKMLIVYPLFLFYVSFAMIVIF